MNFSCHSKTSYWWKRPKNSAEKSHYNEFSLRVETKLKGRNICEINFCQFIFAIYGLVCKNEKNAIFSLFSWRKYTEIN